MLFLTTIPSVSMTVSRARDLLASVIPDGGKYISDYNLNSYPLISHDINVLYESCNSAPVASNGIYGFSPYVCPFNGADYKCSKAMEYLYARRDLQSYLQRLSGRTLICNCILGTNDCWAHVLQNAYFREVDVHPADYDDSEGDMKWPQTSRSQNAMRT